MNERAVVAGSLLFAALAAWLYLGAEADEPAPAPTAEAVQARRAPPHRSSVTERPAEAPKGGDDPGPILEADLRERGELESPTPPIWVTIEGRVIDSTQTATSRGRVVAWIAGKKQVTRPDERGRFRYHQPGGAVRIRAEAEGDEGPLASEWVVLDAREGGSWNLNLLLLAASP